MQLEQLKQYYSFFSVQWNEWLEYKGVEYLSEQDLYALSVFEKNNFKIKLSEEMMFYNKTRLIKGIIDKLEYSKIEFKEWLIERWQFSLIKAGLSTDLTLFVTTKIEELEIDEKFKHLLRQFKKNTIAEILDSYSDFDFASEVYFKIIKEYMTLIHKPLYLTPSEKEILEKINFGNYEDNIVK